ncbi:PiggyBac transposable element-derived protein 4 [Plakobranchus ocellatus]|uniref:PiggyBac transposable element-derived protein 4 n=1 Tax=Plakobranchus ocellatus TaxID=259542 RepID=A0AAV3ZB99_9GAST|nr:PiggyBac transposable element-derived protein 4 [Plakobranchus ocellatus]
MELSAPYNYTNRNITTDNFFTSLQLAVALRLRANGLTLVGTLRKNKPFIPNEFLPSRQRHVHSAVFGFQKDITLVLHVPKQGKAVILLSTMHHNKAVDLEQMGKPEINLYYNKTKGGVDSLDQLVHAYMSKRQTVRWPLSFFFNLLDVAGVASFVIWTLQNPLWKENKKHKRRLFLEEMSEQLVIPQIQRRVGAGHVHKSVLLSAELCGVTAPASAPVPAQQEEEETAKKKRCVLCGKKKDRKSKQTCNECKRPVCNEHSQAKKICMECQ